MKDRVIFAPNIPQTIALEYAEGRKLETGNVMFSLMGGRVMFLNPDIALKIEQLGVKPGECFGICKRWNGQRGRASVTRWDVWLTPKSEQNRATEQSPGNLDASPRSINGPSSPPRPQVVEIPLPARALQPTGTDGPKAAPCPQTLPRKAPQMERIPFNVAFTEAVKIVKDGLQANGEVWNDQARQDIVSTILIAAANHGWVTVWERDGA